MTIKALYRPSEQKLRVEVLNATNLIPLDSNGGCGWAGEPHCPGTPWVGGGVPLPRDPLSLVPGMPQSGQMLAVLGLSLDLIFLPKEVDLREKGGYCTGPGWSSGIWQAGPGRTQCPHPTGQQPGEAAFLHRAKQSRIKKTRAGTCSRSGCRSESSPGEVTPPAASPSDRYAGRVRGVPAPSRSPGWAGGCDDSALTPPCSHPSVSKPPRLGSSRGRGARGRG